jgi:hypothetical protein
VAAETSVRVRIRIGDVGIIRGIKSGEDVVRGWFRPGGLASGRVLSRARSFEVEVAELWRGLDALVAEPERDYAGVDAGFQEPHGGGVSQYVAVTFFSPMLGH